MREEVFLKALRTSIRINHLQWEVLRAMIEVVNLERRLDRESDLEVDLVKPSGSFSSHTQKMLKERKSNIREIEKEIYEMNCELSHLCDGE